jgi:hypothetical protein
MDLKSGIVKNTYNGTEYYKYNGVYYYREDGVFDDDAFFEKMKKSSELIKNRAIYIFRSPVNNMLMCEYERRIDCHHETVINGCTVVYREEDINFNDADVMGFVMHCLEERRNYNVVCYCKDKSRLNPYMTITDLTLFDFFHDFCD